MTLILLGSEEVGGVVISALQSLAKCHALMSGSHIFLPHSFKNDPRKESGSNMQINSMKRLQSRPARLSCISACYLLFYMIRHTWSYLQPDQRPSQVISANLTAYSTISFANILISINLCIPRYFPSNLPSTRDQHAGNLLRWNRCQRTRHPLRPERKCLRLLRRKQYMLPKPLLHRRGERQSPWNMYRPKLGSEPKPCLSLSPP